MHAVKKCMLQTKAWMGELPDGVDIYTNPMVIMLQKCLKDADVNVERIYKLNSLRHVTHIRFDVRQKNARDTYHIWRKAEEYWLSLDDVVMFIHENIVLDFW